MTSPARASSINYTGDGSAAGRQHYIENQADFASSDIAFLTTPDPFGAGTERRPTPTRTSRSSPVAPPSCTTSSSRARRITDLRLSGETLTKIFTGKITDWGDPAITHDYGAPLPTQKITPVTRSDGAGASYMFTRWMWRQYPSTGAVLQQPGRRRGLRPDRVLSAVLRCGAAQRLGPGRQLRLVPSFGEGSIGYDEYAYALNNGIPVVKMLNTAGYYSLPTPSNVAIALQAAMIDENPASPTFLMQDLDHVYTNPDPRTYPLSSYSYLIVPRAHRA